MGRHKGGKNSKLKTQCKNGHLLTADNLYIRVDKNGREERHCRECGRRRNSLYKQTAKGRASIKRNYHNHLKYFSEYNARNRDERKTYFMGIRPTLKRRFASLKGTAGRIGRNFTVTFDEYCSLVKPNACKYCGKSLLEAGGGLDRQDNRVDYIIENVVPCCWPCNRKKGCLENAGFVYPRTVELLTELLTRERQQN